MTETNGQSKQPELDPRGRYRLDVGADEDGSCVIDQTDLETHNVKRVAIFPADEVEVKVPTEDGDGYELATRDMAEVRAMVFTRIFIELASSGKLGT